MTKHFPSSPLRFYLTAPAPCPYLPALQERKVFTSLESNDAVALNNALTHAGFRRSQNIAYRPACEACEACLSARICALEFVPTRRWKRVLAANGDLVRARKGAMVSPEHFALLQRYLNARHSDGGMAGMSFEDFASMVEDTLVHTHIVEYRPAAGPLAGRLIAAALVDVLRDGLSLVYSFFDPDFTARSLGSFIILDHVRQAQLAKIEYVYIGYWISGSEKMAYKAAFQPLELLQGGAWRRDHVHGASGPGAP